MSAQTPSSVHGLVLGKFLPPHRGHLHLVAEAAQRCDQLTVVVGTLAREPIPGELRFAWMQACVATLDEQVDLAPSRAAGARPTGKALPGLKNAMTPRAPANERALRIPQISRARRAITNERALRVPQISRARRALIRVVHLTDENPQYPHEHPDFWAIWVASLRRVVAGPIDVVFSSEDYGDELAYHLGARHEAIDKARVAVPVSGTMIRQCPYAAWDYIPPLVRPYFLKRVCIVGPESTGKTTLARTLAEHYRTVWVPEYARSWLDAKSNPCELTDMVPIAQGQVASEDELASQACGVLICDTDPMTTSIWSERYFGEVPDDVSALAQQRRYDLYLVTAADVPWVADRHRDQPHAAAWFAQRFAEEVARRGVPWVAVRGSWKERFALAQGAIDALLGLPPPASPSPTKGTAPSKD